MKKGIIFFGPAESGKSRKSLEIAATYPEGTVKIFDFRKKCMLEDPFVFSPCDTNTELVIIDDLTDPDFIELFFIVITGKGLKINKIGKESLYIKPKVLIICDSRYSITNFPKSASFRDRFDTYQFPEAYNKDIQFRELNYDSSASSIYVQTSDIEKYKNKKVKQIYISEGEKKSIVSIKPLIIVSQNNPGDTPTITDLRP